MVGTGRFYRAGRRARGDDMQRGKGEKGQALIELAFVFMLLVAMGIALADFAYVFRQYVQVVNAANSAVNYAAKGAPYAMNQPGVVAAARSEARDTRCNGGGSENLQVSVPVTSTVSLGVTQVTVRVQCEVTVPIPLGLPNSITVGASATRRLLEWILQPQ
jgi:Flp pilus assembly protein TadG